MFVSLISGSSGNATFVSDGNTNILIDCGMSGKKLSEALLSLDLSCNDIDALLLTHEHIDHTRGARIISKKYNIPIYLTQGTLFATDLKDVSQDNLNIIKPFVDFEIGKIGICPFSISHDAAEPVGFNCFLGDKKLTLATDTGIITPQIEPHLLHSDEIILESNHDVDMLMYGNYPFKLKKRILSDLGHLSNENAARLATKLLNNGTKKIMLGHLSIENNTPEIAYQTTCAALSDCGAVVGKDILLSVASRYEITRF